MVICMYKMAKEPPQKVYNPWNNLSTVTNFDKGSKRAYSEVYKSHGELIKKMSSSYSSVLVCSLIHHLCSIIEKDPVESEKLYQLLCSVMRRMEIIDISITSGGYEIARIKYNEAVHHLITIAKQTINSKNLISIPRPLSTTLSLYQDQFRETGFIADGGFGRVFRAVHKLDEVEYAIKKIEVDPQKVDTAMNNLEEVKTLAKLNHVNIVTYKQAWIELVQICKNESTTLSECERISTGKKITKSYSSQKSLDFLVDQKSEKNINSLQLEKVEISSDSDSDVVSFNDGVGDSRIREECSLNYIKEVKCTSNSVHSKSSLSSDESFEEQRVCQYSRKNRQYAILYIQMSLCDKTLREWMDERQEPTPITTVAAIATQLLAGLSYIHSMKIVHHDIKPSNIFISTSNNCHNVKLGDFGLACYLQRDHHQSIGGTRMYAAPEQLRGECNPKSDIYSLGIVLLELLVPMETLMECSKMIDTLKNGQVPKTLVALNPQWVTTIQNLIQSDPSRRPSSGQLLQDLKIDKDLTIKKLQDENSRLKLENTALYQENQDQKKEIDQLLAEIKKLKS